MVQAGSSVALERSELVMKEWIPGGEGARTTCPSGPWYGLHSSTAAPSLLCAARETSCCVDCSSTAVLDLAYLRGNATSLLLDKLRTLPEKPCDVLHMFCFFTGIPIIKVTSYCVYLA